MGPAWSRSSDLAQYVRTETDAAAATTFGERYVFARLRQTQLSLTTRVSFILTPRASVQVYMQPLLATGEYGQFKELASPRTFSFLEYGTDALEVHTGAIRPGQRVLVHDDLLATGGTAEAAVRLAESQGGVVVGATFIVELTFLPGRRRLGALPIQSLVSYDTEAVTA